MKYNVIGKSAVLASRSIERFTFGQAITVKVKNVPDDATFTIIGKDDGEKSFVITSQATAIDFSSFEKGTYKVVVKWVTTDSSGNTVRHEAYGSPFIIATDDAEDYYILPAPLARATDAEYLYQAISDILDILLPLDDDFRHGTDVI